MTTKGKHRFAAPYLLLLLAAAAAIGGCEKGDVLAPADGSITLTATPSNLEAPVGDAFATSEIEARVLGASGFPESNVTVTFTTTGAKLNSGGSGIDTDGSGVAKDTLVVRESDVATLPATFTVTARSGSVTKDVSVTVGCPGNIVPVATITNSGVGIDVSDAPSASIAVTLDGSASDDADGTITDYIWTCGNGDVPTEIGGGTSATCDYVAPATADQTQSFFATLVVKDNGNGSILPGGGYACQATSATAQIEVRVTAE